MSFSTEVKEELSALRLVKSCCILSELNALTQSCASITIQGRGQVAISYRCESVTVAKRIFVLLKNGMQINATPHFTKIARFGGRRVCVIRLSVPDTRKLMLALHMLNENPNGMVYRGIPRRALTRKCCQQAFLRGAFLGEGSITQPEHDYHLEFVCNDERRAKSLLQLLSKCDLECKQMTRRATTVIYCKKSQQISALLTLMGAPRAVLQFENLLAKRSLHESIIRATNCDNNNMKRQLNASQKQVMAIEELARLGLLDTLSPSLQNAAHLRLKNPDASLEQLGEMMNPPLGKSGVNHRLRRIMEYYQSLTDK